MWIRVGIQTHISILSDVKLFCKCTPNRGECPICRGLPGARPEIPAKTIIDRCYVLADALGMSLNPEVVFYRKHYRYHDLPTGSQRTQHPGNPLGLGGVLRLLDGTEIAVSEVHLEEDPAASTDSGVSFLRAGSPLLQVVTPPVFSGIREEVTKKVLEYLRTLRQVSEDLGVISTGGVMKSDINVSGTKARMEIKNLSSYDDVRCALSLITPELLNEQTSKTYHLRGNSLEFSRDKTEYTYCLETNLPTISWEGSLRRVTLYPELYRRLITLEGANHQSVLALCNRVVSHPFPRQWWESSDFDTLNFQEVRARLLITLLSPQVKSIILRTLAQEPGITTKDLSRKLKDQGVFLRSQEYTPYLKYVLSKMVDSKD